jgi:hypothetical protein
MASRLQLLEPQPGRRCSTLPRRFLRRRIFDSSCSKTGIRFRFLAPRGRADSPATCLSIAPIGTPGSRCRPAVRGGHLRQRGTVGQATRHGRSSAGGDRSGLRQSGTEFQLHPLPRELQHRSYFRQMDGRLRCLGRGVTGRQAASHIASAHSDRRGRPPWISGGVETVARAFELLRDRVRVKDLLGVLARLDHAYPYHQSVGFYMERTGFDSSALARLRELGTSYDFHLAHAMKGTTRFDRKWRVRYPASLG